MKFLKRQSPDVVILRNINEASVNDIPKGKVTEYIDKDLVDLDEFASLCSNIYEEQENEIEIKEFAAQEWELYDKPKVPSAPSKWKYHITGLGCMVWVKKRPGSKSLVLIVFRGTDPKQVGDWVSNFRWLMKLIPFIWDQYDQTQALIPKLVTKILSDYGNEVEIASTGHSLGGGLAQHAAYVSKRINIVYAFDPSIVTGYYSVCKKEREMNQLGMRIYRIYEHGEILAYIRWLWKSIYPISYKDPKIVEIRYNLTTGNAFSQHSMKDLAMKLREIVVRNS